MEKYYLRAIRIAAKNKLQDRWIHSQWYQPLDAEDAGTTFVLIEVVNPWFPSPQITTTITNTFNREYFRQRRVSSAADAFEIAVRRVNEALAARAEEGETDWIGSLHALLAVVAGNEIHLVQAGKAVALIFRNGTLNPVVGPRSLNDPPPPLHTFTSIATGTLESGDKGILATPDLLDYISTDDVAASLTKSIDPAAKDMVKILQAKRVRTPHAVLFDYAATPHPDRAREDADTIFLDVPLEGGLTRVKHVTKHVVVPALQKGIQTTGSAASWFWGKTRTDFFPKIKNAASRVASRGKDHATKVADKTVPLVSAVTEKTNQTMTAAAEHIEETKPRELITKPAGWFAAILNRLTALARSVKLRSRLLWIAAVIVVVGVAGLRVVTVRRANEAAVARSTAQEALIEAQKKKEEADLALVYNETEQAIALFVEALQLAEQAGAHPDLAATAREVYLAVQQSLDQLTRTTRIVNATPYAQFQEVAAFTMVESTAWTITDDGRISAAPVAGEATVEATLSGLGRIAALRAITDTNNLFVVGSEGVGVVRLLNGSSSVLARPEGGWLPADAVESFAVNLYFLDATAGQIWRYPTSPDGTVRSVEQYFAEPRPLSGAQDLAIDGNIFILFADGTVQSYFRGEPEAFAISGLPSPYATLTKPQRIATDPAANGLYVYDADTRHIVELTKEGAYQRQFALPDDWDVRDIQVAGTAKKLYVLAGSNIYEIGL